MDSFHVYKDMEARTKGEIYLGVVGPVFSLGTQEAEAGGYR